MTTYTIYRDGNGAISGLSVADAAVEILTADGQDYKICREPDCWRLRQRQEVANVKGDCPELDTHGQYSRDRNEAAHGTGGTL